MTNKHPQCLFLPAPESAVFPLKCCVQLNSTKRDQGNKSHITPGSPGQPLAKGIKDNSEIHIPDNSLGKQCAQGSQTTYSCSLFKLNILSLLKLLWCISLKLKTLLFLSFSAFHTIQKSCLQNVGLAPLEYTYP